MSYRDISFCAWCEAKMPRWELADTDGEQGTRWFCTLACLGEWVKNEKLCQAVFGETDNSQEHALAEESEEIAAKVREEEE